MPPSPPPDFQQLFEQLPGAYLVALPDADFTLMAVSDAYLRATGTTREDLLGHPLLELFPDNREDPNAAGVHDLRASLERTLTTRAPDTMAVRKHDLQRPEAEGGGFEERYWRPLTTPVLSPEGEVRYLLHRLEDVTDFVRLSREHTAALQGRTTEAKGESPHRAQTLQADNQELRATQERLLTERTHTAEEMTRDAAILQAILQAIPDGLYVGDATGIKLANRPALEMLGFQSLEELNQNVASLGERLQNHSAEDGHRLAPEEEPFMRAFRGKATTQEVRARHLLTGRDVVVRCAAAPVCIGDDIIGAVAVNTDITERKHIEEELRQTAEFRERFLGIVSHDLRSPLSAILLSSNALMRSEDIIPKHLTAVRRIALSAERMERMISDLLDFTRGRLGGGIPISPRPANLRALCQQVREELEIGHPQRALRLSVHAGHFRGEWDADRLTQLLGNLGKNALDYSPTDTPVDFVLRDEGEQVCVEVHNEGPAISPDLLPHLFEPFRRATDKGHPTSGLGLGLFIAQQIVRAHGGHVEARSSQEEGTTFTLWLPRSVPVSSSRGPDGTP
ncbi:ATP-binding protein [Myxococcus sp. QH3KD-4-1]|nr:ATP-binding protein [Myxococcus qinghaiensis]